MDALRGQLTGMNGEKLQEERNALQQSIAENQSKFWNSRNRHDVGTTRARARSVSCRSGRTNVTYERRAA